METTKVEAVTELFSKTTKVEAGAALLGTNLGEFLAAAVGFACPVLSMLKELPV